MKMAILSFLTACGIAAMGLYHIQDYQKTTTHIQTRLTALDTQSKIKRSEIMALQRELSELKQADDWRISEVLYLLRLAEEQLHIRRDIPTAIRLLKTANQQLTYIQDPTLSDVRTLIQEHQTALEAIKLPNLETLWLNVGTLMDRLPALHTRGVHTKSMPPRPSDTRHEPPTSHTIDKGLRAGLYRTWQELKAMIKIQHHSKPIEPILLPTEQLLALEHLHLMLEQIRFAILHSQPTIYRESIRKANDWLETYFEATDEQVQTLRTALSHLNEIDLCPQLPNIKPILQRLQDKR